MDKEDKKIIDRAVKEEWRIGDRSRLKRLLEKNLKQYRDNVELERKLEQTEKDLADYQFNYPTIKELEQENAELKEQNRNYEQLIDNGSVTLAKERLKNYKQLTKAKELLELFVQWNYGCCKEPDYKDIVKQAEQFLKEIEK